MVLMISLPISFAFTLVEHPIMVGSLETIEAELANDTDKDGIRDKHDNCMFYYNPGQGDVDNNGIGNACDEVVEEWCEERRPQDIDDDGVYEYCGMTTTGYMQTAQIYLSNLGVDEDEHNDIMALLRQSIRKRESGELYFFFHQPYALSYRGDDYTHYFGKINQAVELLETHGSSFGVEDEYNNISDSLLLGVRQLVELKLKEITVLRNAGSFSLSDSALDLQFNTKLNELSNSFDEGNSYFDSGQRISALQEYEDAYGLMVELFDFLFVEQQVTVGTSGGTVQSVDGLMEIIIPPGALSEDTVFTVQLLKGEDMMWNLSKGTLASPSYAVSPNVQFNTPVTVRIVSPLGLYAEELLEIPLGTLEQVTEIVNSNPDTTEIYGATYTTIDEDDGWAEAQFNEFEQGALSTAYHFEIPGRGTGDPGDPGTGQCKVFMSQPGVTFPNGSAIPMPVGKAGCMSPQWCNMTEGNEWCDDDTRHYTYGTSVPYGYGAQVTDIITHEMIWENEIKVRKLWNKLSIWETVGLVAGVVGVALIIIDITVGPKLSLAVITAAIKGAEVCTITGCTAAIISIFVTPSRFGICWNHKKRVHDCNHGDQCDLEHASMNAVDGWCDNTNGSTYYYYQPMPFGDVNCRHETANVICTNSNGPLCTPWDSHSVNCRLRKGYTGYMHWKLRDNTPGCEEDDVEWTDIDINHWNCVADEDYGPGGIVERYSSYNSFYQWCDNDVIRSYTKSCTTVWDWVVIGARSDGYGNWFDIDNSKSRFYKNTTYGSPNNCNDLDNPDFCRDGFCTTYDADSCYYCDVRIDPDPCPSSTPAPPEPGP